MPPGDPRLEAGFGLEESEIRGLVNSAVLRDDVTPLLRILFSYTTAAIAKEKQEAAEAAAAAAAAAVQGQPAFAGPAYGGAPAASQTRVDQALGGHEALAVMSKCLKAVAGEQDQVIKEICHTHAMDIAGFVTDLHDMQSGVGDLQELLDTCNSQLQEAGQPLLQHLSSMSELVAVQDKVSSGVQAIRGARDVLQRCLQVGQLLEERQLYQALRAINHIQAKHLPALLEKLSSADGTQAGGSILRPGTTEPPNSNSWGAAAGGGGGGGGGGGAAGRRLANVVALRAYFEGLVSELLAAVEALAISEMHTWLESARKQARSIGLHTIRQAAIQRQRNEDLARERLLLSEHIHAADRTVGELSATLVSAAFRQEMLREGGWPPAAGAKDQGQGTGGKEAGKAARHPGHAANGSAVIRIQSVMGSGELEQLQAGSPHLAVAELVDKCSKQQRRRQARQAAAVKAGGQGVDAGVQGPGSLMGIGAQLCAASDATLPVMAGLAMRGLLSCVHIYQVLGRTGRLQEYYSEQRRLQITADLAAPYIPFLEHYQSYLGQVLGFFVIESSVRRLVPHLMPTSTAAALWEATVSQVKATLETALCRVGHLMTPAAGQTPAGQQQGTGRPRDGGRAASRDAAAQAAIMIMIKDFVLLMVEALEHLGCAAVPLQEVLAAAAVPYHDLITSDTLSKVKHAVSSDTLADKVQVKTSSDLHNLMHTLGLPASLIPPTTSSPAGQRALGAVKPTPAADPPFACPFSSMVPALLHLIRDFINDSASYLRGVVPSVDMAAALTHHRDRLVQQVIAEVLLARIQAANSMHAVLCMAANTWCLAQAVPALEVQLEQVASPLATVQPEAGPGAGSPGKTWLDVAAVRDQAANRNRSAVSTVSVLTSCALGQGAMPPSLLSSLQSVQQAAERALLRMVMSGVDDILAAGFKSTNWLPTSYLDTGPSPHVQPLITYLQGCFDDAVHGLPAPAWTFLMRTAIKSVGLSYMKLFAPDGIKGYNLIAIERLSFDISAVQNFAARSAAHASASYLHQVKAFGAGPATLYISPIQQQDVADQLAEPEQLFRLLLAHKFDEVSVAEVRRRAYPNLGLSTILLALDKYRELTKVDKVATPFPTRKQVDAVVKTLQAQLTTDAA